MQWQNQACVCCCSPPTPLRPQRNRPLCPLSASGNVLSHSAGSDAVPSCGLSSLPSSPTPLLRTNCMLYAPALNVGTYCMLSSWHLIILSIMLCLLLAIFVDHGEWVNLGIVSAWHRFYEHPYCTDSNILFLFLLTNVLIVSPTYMP